MFWKKEKPQPIDLEYTIFKQKGPEGLLGLLGIKYKYIGLNVMRIEKDGIKDVYTHSSSWDIDDYYYDKLTRQIKNIERLCQLKKDIALINSFEEEKDGQST
jgi:hypothetical protein